MRSFQYFLTGKLTSGKEKYKKGVENLENSAKIRNVGQINQNLQKNKKFNQNSILDFYLLIEKS